MVTKKFSLQNIKKIAIIFALVYSQNVFAGEIGILLPGLSYHIGADSSNPAYKKAPRKLDKNGAFVFNPGVGIGYDFRDKEDGSSLSLIMMGMTFKDCDNRSAYTTGIGGRYRHHMNDNISLDADLYLALYSAQDWKTGEYNNSITPFPSIGMNYHFDQTIVGVKTTFAPRNANHSSTASFNLIFAYLYLGYSF